MTQILSAAQLPTDLPNFSIGTYPVEPIALQIAEAFAQSREKNEVVTWTFGGFESSPCRPGNQRTSDTLLAKLGD
jgi:hypothetical protein